MAIISALLSLLGSSAIGSLIGGVFAFLNRKTDLEAKRLDLLHEQARWGHETALRDKDIALAQVEAQGKKDVVFAENDGRFEIERMRAIGQAQAGDQVGAAEIAAAGRMGWLYVVIGAFNKAVRPLATVVVVGAVLWVNWMLISAFIEQWPSLPQPDRLKLAVEALAWLCGQASIILGYWFVSRGTSGPGQIK